MFTFNGHGVTLPPTNSGDNIIKLNEGEFIILNNTATVLRGSSWIQDILFSKILMSKNPIEFVRNIEEGINKNVSENLKKDIFGYFGFKSKLDMTNENNTCPNLQLDSKFDNTEPYDDRFGLFNVPININENNMKYLLDNIQNLKYLDEESKRTRFLTKFSNVNNENLNIAQNNLITNHVEDFSNTVTDLKNLIDYIRKTNNNSPFILFLNVCRALYKNSNYTADLTKNALPLTQLIEILNNSPPTFRLNATASEWRPPTIGLNATASEWRPPTLVLNPSAPEWRPSNYISHIDDELPSAFVQNRDKNYMRIKYLKYKNKYIHLKNKLIN